MSTDRFPNGFPADPLARLHWYRERGFWGGEPILPRYRRLRKTLGERLAVVDDRGQRLTHSDLWRNATRLAARLQNEGLNRGEVGLLYLPNRVQWQEAYLALLLCEAVPAVVPLRTGIEQLRYVCGLSQAACIITCAHHDQVPAADTARQASSESGAAVICLGDRGEVQSAHAAARRPRSAPVEGVQADGARVPIELLMFTSSTTGQPKGVLHSSDTLHAINRCFSERFQIGTQTPLYMGSPLGHSIGAVHGARLSLFHGAPLILQDRWDAERALALMSTERAYFTAAATPFLKDLSAVSSSQNGPPRGSPQDRGQRDERQQAERQQAERQQAERQQDSALLKDLRWFLCGGAQVPPRLMAEARECFPHTFITVLWGMTEGGMTTSVPQTPLDKLLSSAGIPMPGLELRILSSQDEALPCGEQGELAMRGPGVFLGYLEQEALYADSLTADGFFRTGDLGRIDKDGYLEITGRLKDLIIRGGVNISPVPLENALASHAAIARVAVIGVPDERLGERIAAVIVPKDDACPPTLAELVAHARSEGISRYHCPERLLCVSAMPVTPAGKIRKPQLKHQLNL